ncbi:hypothetical protein ED28_02225 [[Pantoea] beijingensis]|uniref:Copper resistance protein C n=1 Tax=[Pantoea] beijingensis TaxID=1324864 RepID=A0A443III9_9GAMM|nr:CopC domain-containing protein YobA [[Pantoea] beijingensis]RWR03826.1 hypothetical protein ED28_02225 [[Pantoea] beijingensis]
MRKFSFPSSAALLITGVAFSQTAMAHAHLKTQYPAADATMDVSPQALTLSFTEGIEPAFSGVEMMTHDRQAEPMAKVERDANNPAQLIVPLSLPLTSGNYQVNWHVLSVDGHKTKGNYTFSVK